MALTTIDDRGLKTPIDLLNNEKIRFGNSDELEIYHDGTDSILKSDTGELKLLTDSFRIRSNNNSETLIRALKDGAVELYHNDVKTFETVPNGVKVVADEGQYAYLYLHSDQGDDDADRWRIEVGNGGAFKLGNYAGGGWETNILCNGNGGVELNHDGGDKKFETTSSGVAITGEATCSAGLFADGDLWMVDQLRHTGDTNTAIRFPSADTVTVETAGEERFHISSTGNVGIGETSPGSLLHVKASDTGIAPHGSSQICLEREGTNYLQFLTAEDGTSGLLFGDGSDVDVGKLTYDHNIKKLQFYTETETAVTIDENQNVGIGTASPAASAAGYNGAALHLHQTNSSSAGSQIHLTNGATGSAAGNGAFLSMWSDDDVYFTNQESDGKIKIATGGVSDAVVIDDSGLVGIGIATPTAFLDVRRHDADGKIAEFHTSTGFGIEIGSSQTEAYISSGNAQKFNLRTHNGTDSLNRLTLKSDGNIGIGEEDPARPLHLSGGGPFIRLTNTGTSTSNGDIMGMVEFETKDSNGAGIATNIRSEIVDTTNGACSLFFSAGTPSTIGTKMEIQNTGNVKINSGSLGVGCTPDGSVGTVGSQIGDSWGIFTRATSIPLYVHRETSDGTLIAFYGQNQSEGNITISDTTVSLTGAHLSRWSQIKGLSTTDKAARPTIYQGTVMSNLDDLCVWNHAEVLYKEGDEIPEGKAVGDVKKAAYTENNQQLNMTKVSDTVGDKDVAGVFWIWDDDDDEIVNDFYIAMTGDMVIRVAGSTTVARGDLLESAGDGTAKPQSDDILRSKTIAKIISTNSTATYPDGSKAYPCVLMAC